MKVLLIVLAFLIISPVPSRAIPVCLDKQDVYRLALADMNRTLIAKWRELAAEDRCADIPAQYVLTLDTYLDADKQFSRVVEMLAFGQRVYALITELPPNVHMVRYDEEWENSPPHIRQWFQSLMRPDFPAHSCCGEADGYEADMFEQDGEDWVAIITGQGPPHVNKPLIAPGTRIKVLNRKMKWDAGNPTGHGIIFLGTDGQVFCYVTPGGA